MLYFCITLDYFCNFCDIPLCFDKLLILFFFNLASKTWICYSVLIVGQPQTSVRSTGAGQTANGTSTWSMAISSFGGLVTELLSVGLTKDMLS